MKRTLGCITTPKHGGSTPMLNRSILAKEAPHGHLVVSSSQPSQPVFVMIFLRRFSNCGTEESPLWGRRGSFGLNKSRLGLITDNSAYRHEVKHLDEWWEKNNLVFNASKDINNHCLEVNKREDNTRHIHRKAVGIAESLNLLGASDSSQMCWAAGTSNLLSEEQAKVAEMPDSPLEILSEHQREHPQEPHQ